MPRYSATIYQSDIPTLKRARYIWAPNRELAAQQAKDWGIMVRKTQFRMRHIDTWTIAERLSPHHAPEVVLSGQIPADE